MRIGREIERQLLVSEVEKSCDPQKLEPGSLQGLKPVFDVACCVGAEAPTSYRAKMAT
jgi:hypothetical protein